MMHSFASNLIYDYDEVTGSLMALTVYVFTYNWFTLHGNALTRARKVFLNVANVLDTYQVYNRKYGHFYESDPDTPGKAAETFKKAAVMSLGDIFNETTPSTSDDSRKFEEAVQKHYAAVYQAVQRSEREMGTIAPVVDDIDTRQRIDNLQEIKKMPALSPDNLTTDKPKMER
uniref:BRO1 domain-containing protein n=1 Tax=Setaria digitata TaxID=48799 RepID=A0A915Q4I4_9BILA